MRSEVELLMAKSCTEYRKWVEEKVEKPIDSWVEKTEKKCKKRKWYDPRGWVCWLVTELVRVVRWVVVWVGKWITYVICEVISFVLNFLATFLWLLMSIPILGRLLAWVWRIALWLGWLIINSIVDGSLALFGIRPRKKVRVCIVILSDSNGPLARPDDFDAAIERARKVYDREANVDFIVSDIKTYEPPAPEAALDVHCEVDEWYQIFYHQSSASDNLWIAGTFFENTGNTKCFDGAFLRLIGYAGPIIAFIVRSVEGDETGCSLGPLTDYVTLEGRPADRRSSRTPVAVGRSLAHEVGHSCNLLHKREEGNLMCPGCAGEDPVLTSWQAFQFRASRHVTFL